MPRLKRRLKPATRLTGALRARLRPATSSAEPSKAARHWLSDIEDLLNASIRFITRAAGSVSLGFFALFRQHPLERLAVLERREAILSWASLVVATSALLGALLPAFSEITRVDDMDVSHWVKAAAELQNPGHYLQRFLPILVMGLVWTFLVGAGVRLLGAPVHEARLLAATVLASSATALLTVSFATTLAGQFIIMRWMEKLTWVEGVGMLAFYCIHYLAYPLVFLAPAVALGRIAWYRLGTVRRPLRRLTKAALLLPVALLGAAMPVTLYQLLQLALRAAPLVEQLRGRPSIEQVLHNAEFLPYVATCHKDVRRQTEGLGTVECELALQTAGEGHVRLGIATKKILLLERLPAARWDERFRLRPTNYSGGEKELNRGVRVIPRPGLVASNEEFQWEFYELGKPATFALTIDRDVLCREREQHPLLLNNKMGKWLYVQARVVGTKLAGYMGEESAYASIGPWPLPADKLSCD